MTIIHRDEYINVCATVHGNPSQGIAEVREIQPNPSQGIAEVREI